MKDVHFVHTTDWHLGFHQYNKYERFLDFRDAAKDIVSKIIEIDPQFVLHTGDIFHHARPTPGTIRQAIKILSKLDKNGIPTYIIRGNHDGKLSKILSRGGGVISLLKDLKLVKYLNDAVYELSNSDVKILGVGYYPSNGVINKLEEILELNPQFLESDNFKILALHAFVEGQLEEISQISLSKISNLGINYVGAGHYHIPWKISKYNIYAPGSSEATSTNDWNRDDRIDGVSMYSSLYEVRSARKDNNWDKLEVIDHKIPVRPKIQINYSSESTDRDAIIEELSNLIEKKIAIISQIEPSLAEKAPILELSLDTNLPFEEHNLISLDKDLENQFLHINFKIRGKSKQRFVDDKSQRYQTIEQLISDMIDTNGYKNEEMVNLIMDILDESSNIPQTRDLSDQVFSDILDKLSRVILEKHNE